MKHMLHICVAALCVTAFGTVLDAVDAESAAPAGESAAPDGASPDAGHPIPDESVVLWTLPGLSVTGGLALGAKPDGIELILHSEANDLTRFRVVPALDGTHGAYSFSLISDPTHFIRISKVPLLVVPYDGGAWFPKDVSFFIRHALNGVVGAVSIEPVHLPGYYLAAFVGNYVWKVLLQQPGPEPTWTSAASFLCAECPISAAAVRPPLPPARDCTFRKPNRWCEVSATDDLFLGDCDGDGFADYACDAGSHHYGTVLSSRDCVVDYPNARPSSCPSFTSFAPTVQLITAPPLHWSVTYSDSLDTSYRVDSLSIATKVDLTFSCDGFTYPRTITLLTFAFSDADDSAAVCGKFQLTVQNCLGYDVSLQCSAGPLPMGSKFHTTHTGAGEVKVVVAQSASSVCHGKEVQLEADHEKVQKRCPKTSLNAFLGQYCWKDESCGHWVCDGLEKTAISTMC